MFRFGILALLVSSVTATARNGIVIELNGRCSKEYDGCDRQIEMNLRKNICCSSVDMAYPFGRCRKISDGCQVPAWKDCQPSEVCAGGFTCCVAPEDVWSGKSTCRLQV